MLEVETLYRKYEDPPPRRESNLDAWILAILAVLAVLVSLLV